MYKKRARLKLNMNQTSDELMDKLRLFQTQEKNLYERLQDPELSAEDRDTVISEMNELSELRINLYKTVRRLFTAAKHGETREKRALEAQLAAAEIIESRLDETKRRANASATLQGQQLRMVQINTYHAKWYTAYTRIMKIIVFMCLPIILVYKFRGIVGETVVNVVLIAVLFFGLMALFMAISDYTTRSTSNFDNYVWSFDADSAPSASDSRKEAVDDSDWNWDDDGHHVSPACTGVDCCAEGMYFDESTNQCANK